MDNWYPNRIGRTHIPVFHPPFLGFSHRKIGRQSNVFNGCDRNNWHTFHFNASTWWKQHQTPQKNPSIQSQCDLQLILTNFGGCPNRQKIMVEYYLGWQMKNNNTDKQDFGETGGVYLDGRLPMESSRHHSIYRSKRLRRLRICSWRASTGLWLSTSVKRCKASCRSTWASRCITDDKITITIDQRPCHTKKKHNSKLSDSNWWTCDMCVWKDCFTKQHVTVANSPLAPAVHGGPFWVHWFGSGAPQKLEHLESRQL